MIFKNLSSLYIFEYYHTSFPLFISGECKVSLYISQRELNLEIQFPTDDCSGVAAGPLSASPSSGSSTGRNTETGPWHPPGPADKQDQRGVTKYYCDASQHCIVLYKTIRLATEIHIFPLEGRVTYEGADSSCQSEKEPWH